MACQEEQATKSCQDSKENLQRRRSCGVSTGGDIRILPEIPAQADTLGDLLVLGHSAQVNGVFEFYSPTNS